MILERCLGDMEICRECLAHNSSKDCTILDMEAGIQSGETGDLNKSPLFPLYERGRLEEELRIKQKTPEDSSLHVIPAKAGIQNWGGWGKFDHQIKPGNDNIKQSRKEINEPWH